MNKKNESLKTIYKTAVEYFQKKDLKTAEIYCLKILSINSNHFNSISMLATIEAIKGNFEKAKELLTKGIEIEPNNVVAILNLGTAYKETGKLDEAISYYNKVLQLVPNHVSAHYNLGLTFYKLRQIKKAKSYFKKTVDIQKNYAIAFFWLGNTHTELKEYNDAVSCYQKAIEINPNIVTAHNNLGLVFNNLNDFQSAITSFQNAVKKQPNHAGAHHNLALTFKNLGKLKEAINSHEMAMKYEPENLAHDYYLSEIKKEVLDSNLKNKINKILGNNKSNNITNVVFGNYLLAKYERKLKKYENEFEFLVKAHHNYFKSQKKKFDLGIKYCFDDVLQISEGVNVKKDDNEKYNKIKPIFIVGVPRCGSTLVEQIIGSGKKTISIGEETSVFENYVNKKILDKQSLNLGSVTEVRNELYNVYHQKGMLSKKYDYIFSDKSLNNFFYLELIKDIYPDAKIIHCKRDTLSSIMSIFQNNLTDLAWTHNLDHIFKYFDNYFRILEKYNEVYPNELYELEFEKLTINPEEESKKLMKFCQLPWDKSCLEFYKKKDLVSKTASNIQIREAIYQHSIKKYLPYKKFLDKHGKKYSWYN